MTIQIDIIDASTVTQGIDLPKMVKALEVQANRDYRPHWDCAAVKLFYVPKDKTPSSDHWWIVLLDDSDVAQALGYHETTKTGLPLGKVFVKTDLHFGQKPSVTVSHELLEMLGDPYINLTSMMVDGLFYAYETADAVEADNFGYDIDGVRVSDFVLPAWFWPFPPPGAKFDFMGHLHGSCPTLLPGGYIGAFNPKTGTWSQVMAKADRLTLTMATPPIGSRRWRRMLSRAEWLQSTGTE